MKLPDNPTSVFTRLRFVLVETSRAGNIGAVARAIKTMGFSDLVLVNPRFADALQDPEAVAFASGAQDVLQQARIVGSMAEALDGCNFAAAVSARLREFSPPVWAPRAFAEHVAGQGDLHAALIFGNELIEDQLGTGLWRRIAVLSILVSAGGAVYALAIVLFGAYRLHELKSLFRRRTVTPTAPASE